MLAEVLEEVEPRRRVAFNYLFEMHGEWRKAFFGLMKELETFNSLFEMPQARRL